MIFTLRQFCQFIQDIIKAIKPNSLKGSFQNILCKSQSFYYKAIKECAAGNKKMRNLVGTNVDLGIYHFHKGNMGDAFFRFRLLQIFTSHLNSLIYYNLGRCYLVNKKLNKAKHFLIKSLRLQENYPEARYCLQKIESALKIEKVPLAVIKEKFNYIAPYYVDHYIIKQQYRGHTIVLHELLEYFNHRSNNINILDVGCGTGICAHFLKMNHVGGNIVGIDISSNMLSVAENCYVKNQAVYTELLNMSDDEYFEQNDIHEQFDAILAIDLICYKKDLLEVFLKYKTALKKNGISICILRLAQSNTIEFIPELDTFSYTQDYMLQLSSELQMEPLRVIKCQLYENIEGLLCILVKK